MNVNQRRNRKTRKRENEKTRKADVTYRARNTAYRGIGKALLLLFICFSVAISVVGCNEPEERSPVVPTKTLPEEKEVLLQYHPAEFLTTEIESAPLLSQANHPHGWQKPDCTRCHRTPTPVAINVCTDCHGENGVNNQVDDCQSCHKVQSALGHPSTGDHEAHVLRGPQNRTCTQCHLRPQNSNVHANGRVNVVLAQGGQFTESGCSGVACHEDREWGGEGCGVCHGNPPDTGLHTVHLAEPDVTCRDCHADNQHDDDKNAGEIELGGIEYNKITGSCIAICHENEPQDWGCNSCHGYPPESGNHDQTVHKFGCDQCHSDHSHSYVAATRPLDFQNTTVSLARGGDYHDSTNDGEPNGTCSGVGCHEERVWGTNCSDCHGNPPDTGTHRLHVVQEELGCRDCHGGNQHDLDNTSGVVEVGGLLDSYDLLSGDCTSVCHQRQRWTCDVCHGFPPESGTHTSHNMPTGNFIKRGRITCDSCHADHQHSYKAAIDSMDFSNVSVAFGFSQGSFDPATQTCSGTECHEPLVWGSQCEDCHGEPPNTGAHLAHVGQDNITCDTCHAGRQHDLDDRSGTIDVAGDFTYNALTGGCTTSCHPRVEQWGCETCHGNPPLTGQHQVHAIDLKFDCRICHSDHEHSFRSATMPNDQRDAGVKFTVRGVWNPATQTCTSVGCHGDLEW